jgi:hypothetical protein
MARASWNGTVLAESDQTLVVESNHYFPPDSLRMEFFRPSGTHTTCAWKGIAATTMLKSTASSTPMQHGTIPIRYRLPPTSLVTLRSGKVFKCKSEDYWHVTARCGVEGDLMRRRCQVSLV